MPVKKKSFGNIRIFFLKMKNDEAYLKELGDICKNLILL